MLVCVCAKQDKQEYRVHTHMHIHTHADIPVYPVPNSAIQADQAGPAQASGRARETAAGR